MKESSVQVKGVNLRRLYTEWFQLYNSLEKAKTMGTIKKGPLLPEILEGEMNGQSTEDFFCACLATQSCPTLVTP